MKKTLAVLITLLVIGSYGMANAFIWAEIPDAGSFLNSAQIVTGVGTIDSITGWLFDGTDEDMFEISSTGGNFTAGTSGAVYDTLLCLFNTSGQLILWDDDSGGGLQAYIHGTLSAGNYFLAISSYSNHPSNWYSPSNILAYWENDGSYSGTYAIALTGATAVNSTSAPEPTTMLLVGLGLVGLAGIRRKMR